MSDVSFKSILWKQYCSVHIQFPLKFIGLGPLDDVWSYGLVLTRWKAISLISEALLLKEVKFNPCMDK